MCLRSTEVSIRNYTGNYFGEILTILKIFGPFFQLDGGGKFTYGYRTLSYPHVFLLFFNIFSATNFFIFEKIKQFLY